MAEFNQLLISNIEYLKPYAAVFTHDSESAKDLLQETLCRALAHRSQYSDETNIKGWLYTIQMTCIMRPVAATLLKPLKYLYFRDTHVKYI